MEAIGTISVEEFVKWVTTEDITKYRAKRSKGAASFDTLVFILSYWTTITNGVGSLEVLSKYEQNCKDRGIVTTDYSKNTTIKANTGNTYNPKKEEQTNAIRDAVGKCAATIHNGVKLSTLFEHNGFLHQVFLYKSNQEKFIHFRNNWSLWLGGAWQEETSCSLEVTVEKLINLLKNNKQIILKGPPGTGKTRLAQMVAKEIADPAQIQLIQFHPSYSYEDFIMGLEVGTDGNGNITYDMKSRGIKKFADEAKKMENEEKTFVLIIDEINRAPVSSVFGELMYALEYRGEEITLSSSEKMTLPKNLYIIGTMNTADRSIAELDYAMQRRFDFVEIPPTAPSKEDLSGKIFAKSLYDSIQGIFKRENIMTGIDPKDVQLGTSYFIYDGNPDHLNYKINYQIIPLLTEYYKDGVFRKKQVMFDNGTFEYWLQENKTGLADKFQQWGGTS